MYDIAATFTNDGDGNRVKQVIGGGNTTLYINKFYEKLVPYSDTGNLTSTTTSYYYFGGRLVAMKQGSANVTFVHQDHLTVTSVVSDSTGALVNSIVTFLDSVFQRNGCQIMPFPISIQGSF